MDLRRRTAGIALAAALLQPLAASPARAQHQENPGNQFAAGVACFVISPFYGAVKVAFGMAGGIVGTLAWAFSGGDTDTGYKVWEPTMKGTYVISPDHLRGQKAVQFIGTRTR